MGSDLSDDEDVLKTPKFARRSSRFSITQSTPGTGSSLMGSVILGPISDEVLRIWCQLPECIRLDPSLGAIQREYERIALTAGHSRSLCGPKPEDTVVVNMSITAHQSPSTKIKGAAAELGNDLGAHGRSYQNRSPVYRYSKLVLLICCWITFTVVLMAKGPKVPNMSDVVVSHGRIESYPIPEDPTSARVSIMLEGPFIAGSDGHIKTSGTTPRLIVWLEATGGRAMSDNASVKSHQNLRCSMNSTEEWIVPIFPVDAIDLAPITEQTRIFELKNLTDECSASSKQSIVVKVATDLPTNLSISIAYDLFPSNVEDGIAYGACVLVGLYIVIIFEVIHRALAAMMASTMSIAILTAFDARPSMAELISWIDIDTLLLLFSMMILVAIFAETGIFDYAAVYAFKVTGGKLWPLINILCFFTAFISSFLDNVSTVLLMTPVTIRLCEVKQLNPVPILTAMIVFSNIGGAATPVGDPPNVIIASNRDVAAAGVTFGTFTLHMGTGVVIVLAVVYAQLRFIFRDVSVLTFDEPQDVQELRHEIAVWQRAACSLSSYSKEENLVRSTLVKKIHRLSALLEKKLLTGSVAMEKYKTTLEELQEKYPITNRSLLIKSSIALTFVILLFFLHNLPSLHLSLGWIGLLGVLLLLVLADFQDIEAILARVEWSTLLFFASLFVLMEALSKLGLITWVGQLTENVIFTVSEESRLGVAIILILWVSALVSAFVDNVPLATMMVRISTNLANNEKLNLPLQPLVWALAFGACLGGNATLIGATANVVCAGVAEQHGYRFSFVKFFKVGFPIMVSSTATITVYLIVCHVVFDWN
ncbi:P protein [Venturia canescens]|uniref:P protein n=1 Tax=Venturia canescens TaxID=32260 RepID=UPI001C9BD5DC|nr:P protein [Venturia canescens]XP_043286805.1 P protein [Venturia canescens]